jgi:uncharacterized NAD(P)/FAD-binding protein YdhS
LKTLAIIGLGPRGLFALENVLENLCTAKKALQIILFEPSKYPGTGPVWNLEQKDSNWINITERALGDINERPRITYFNHEIPSFPSYIEWANYTQKPTQPDTFPPRNKVGTYLHERFMSLKNALTTNPHFKLIPSKVDIIKYENDKFIIHANENTYSCDDALITIGHQPTEPSKQIVSWTSHAKTRDNLQMFNDAYPVSQFDELKNKTDVTIGLRGFGLAMIDVMRALVINNFGNFKTTNPSTFETIYFKSKEQNLKLVPFSLDGLPMVPKPLNPEIDEWYKLTDEEIAHLKYTIETHAKIQANANYIDFLIEPIAKIVARIYLDLGAKAISHKLDAKHVETVVLIWLKNQDYDHVLIQDTTIDSYKLISSYIEMALGEQSISLDFCIGQVWRHCQPTLYKTLSHSKLDDELIEDVIALDESTKRYSYGPPIESMQQILALVDAEVLSLDYVNDPDILMKDKGWELKNDTNQSITATVMINSVLDAPKLLDVNSSIIVNLLKDDLIEPIHTKLGIETFKNGYVKSSNKNKQLPVAVLGRLAKGSVIGVDAILECFGDRIEDYAQSFVNKLD